MDSLFDMKIVVTKKYDRSGIIDIQKEFKIKQIYINCMNTKYTEHAAFKEVRSGLVVNKLTFRSTFNI